VARVTLSWSGGTRGNSVHCNFALSENTTLHSAISEIASAKLYLKI
jgi:hypothetical protein